MKRISRSFEQVTITRDLIKWTLLTLPMALVVGSVIAFFLWLLEKATTFRWQHPWMLFLLPLAGVIIVLLYKCWGKNSDGGNNLIMDEIHKPGGGVPARMAPLVLFATVFTHWFGGSAGREGTAIQIGGSISHLFGRWFRLTEKDMRIMLMTGVAAGFGGVFGVPLTGAIFALEVLAIGRIQYNALIPCLIASFIANITCHAWGIHHALYHILFNGSVNYQLPFFHYDFLLLAKVIAGGILFGLAGFLFAELTHTLKNYSNKWISQKWLIPVVGGAVIIILTYLLGTRDYLGIGVTSPNPGGVSIESAFHAGGATYWSWFWKLLFTAITLSTGFKGGEVTPLFFIGAALGNTIAAISGAPVDLMAGLGFIAVFAGATNAPIACTLMGAEIFGTGNILYFAIACFTAYYFSGHSGIYSSQLVAISKPRRKRHMKNIL